MKRMFTFLSAIFAFVIQTFATPQPEAPRADGADSPAEKYSYVIVLDNDTTLEISDSLFYSISRQVIFPVNEYTIPEGTTFRREVEQEIMPYMNDRHHVLERVIVRGAASPEGPYDNNQMLSRNRAQALIDIISHNSRIPIDPILETERVAEDYIYLLLLMKEKADADYHTVATIVNSHIANPLELKAALQQHSGGKLWSRLLRQYFPTLRAARVVFIFKKYQDIPQTEIQKAPFVPLTARMEPISLPPYTQEKQPRRELLSVKTNLLFDAAMTPNLAIEYYPLHGHFTYGASMDFPWWQNHKDHHYWQIRNYQLEARYYFRSGCVDRVGYGGGPAFRGWYLQAYAHVGLYSICFDANHGYEGEGVGGGLGVGYVMPISKDGHWRLEFALQAGYFRTWYDPYQWRCPVDPNEGGDLYYYKWTGKPEDFKERQHRFTWLGPTRVGVTLSYDILYRRRAKSGASFRKWEK